MTRVRPRWALVVGSVWLLAGLTLLGATVAVVVGGRALHWWELPLTLALAAVGVLLLRCEITVDEGGIGQRTARRSRVLWGAIDRVVITLDGWGPPLSLVRRGSGAQVVLSASWGLTRRQRHDLRMVIIGAVARFEVALDPPVLPAPDKEGTGQVSSTDPDHP